MRIKEYINKIGINYTSGITSGQLYQGYLKMLINTYASDVSVTEGPVKLACSTPDYIITKGNIPVGYMLTFGIDKPLDSQGNKKEFALCKKNLANLMLTNHLEFHLYRDGIFTSSASIAEIKNGGVISKPGDHASVEALIKEFSSYQRVASNSSLKLSRTTAKIAQLLAAVMEKSIIQDEKKHKNQHYESSKITLKEKLTDISIVLRNDISAKDLANIYAQTISYGMFAARLYGGPALQEFSRYNAADFIPLSYPFLKKLYQYLAGEDLDDRLTWIINELADVFRNIDIAALLENFMKPAQQINPVINFHKNFLNEYNPGLLKERGEILATEPLVRFMMQAVNDCISSIE